MTRTYWIILAAIALVLIVGAASVGADPELGDTVEVPPGEPTTLTAYPLCSSVTWDAPTLADATTDDANRLHFTSGAVGRKDVVTAHARHWFFGTALSHTTTVNVVGHAPVNNLVALLRKAYEADGATAYIRHQQKLSLIGIYEAACTYCREAKLATVDQLLREIHETAATLITPGALAGVRSAIRDVLLADLGDDPAQELDQATRDKAEKAFRRVAQALKEVG